MHVASALRDRGVSSATIFGDTPSAERDHTIAAFKRGEIRALASMGVLTTGFNAPAVDLIAMLRPTKSTGLYVQMAGRGTRLEEEKAPSPASCRASQGSPTSIHPCNLKGGAAPANERGITMKLRAEWAIGPRAVMAGHGMVELLRSSNEMVGFQSARFVLARGRTSPRRRRPVRL